VFAFRAAVAATAVAVAMAVTACGPPPSSPAGDNAANGDTGAQEPAAGHIIHGSPPPPPAPLRPGERFEAITLAQPYRPAPPPGGTDEYRCFLVDLHLSASAFLMGTQFLPQNTEIVHHAILYSIGPAEVAHAQAVDAADPGDGWQCFGGTGLNAGVAGFSAARDTPIGGWAPGNTETLLPGLVGFPVAAGTQIVLQIHYNLLATKGKPGPVDQSSARLRLMPGTAAVTPLTGVRLVAPIELPCTPAESGPLCDRTAAINDLVQRTGVQARATVNALGAYCHPGAPIPPGPTQSCDNRIGRDVLVYAVAPHMHLLGRSIKVELNPGTPNAVTLLDQPAYNFDDQSTVLLARPVRLRPTDTVRLTCSYDASLRSKLPELKPLAPRYVVWGDGTSDEMCLATLAGITQF
jgi:hypothetical protein